MSISVAYVVGTVFVGVVLAYLIGSIPTGVITSKALLGIDLRKHGSGNVGTTNAMRTGGFRTGALVCILDILKGVLGVLAMWLVISLARTLLAPQLGVFAILLGDGHLVFDIGMGLAQVAATFGHMHSPFMKFHGGKGIATSFGGFLVAVPWCALVAVICFALGCLLSRYASVGSMAGAAGYLVSCIIVYHAHIPLVLAAVVIFCLVVYAHRGNIVRLVHRQEPRISIGSKEKIEQERRAEAGELDAGAADDAGGDDAAAGGGGAGDASDDAGAGAADATAATEDGPAGDDAPDRAQAAEDDAPHSRGA